MTKIADLKKRLMSDPEFKIDAAFVRIEALVVVCGKAKLSAS